MYNIFWGCPFLSLLFLFAIGLGMAGEHRLLKRQRVPSCLYWRVMLSGAWPLSVTAFAILWLASTAGRRGVIQFKTIQAAFLVFVLAHNAVLKPVYMKYRRMAIDRSAYSVWGR